MENKGYMTYAYLCNNKPTNLAKDYNRFLFQFVFYFKIYQNKTNNQILIISCNARQLHKYMSTYNCFDLPN